MQSLFNKRNTVERAINKLKQFRAVATRYALRKAWIHLPRHHGGRSTGHLAAVLTPRPWEPLRR
jgi:transposase